MKHILLIIVFITQPLLVNATDTNAAYEEQKEFQAALLRSNYKETKVTAWVKIIHASIYEKMPPIYTKYKFKCEVIEIFKGVEVKEIEFIRFMETLSVKSKLKDFVGKTGIISVFFSEEKKQYYIGDNGYNLPDTPYLLQIARNLKHKDKS